MNPYNTTQSRPQISDFGMAKSYRAGHPSPVFLASYGSIYYAAPEGEFRWTAQQQSPPSSDFRTPGVSDIQTRRTRVCCVFAVSSALVAFVCGGLKMVDRLLCHSASRYTPNKTEAELPDIR